MIINKIKIMSENDFKVGDSIICVNPTDYLVEGQVYTVSEVHDDGLGVNVKECIVPYGYLCYSSDRFAFPYVTLDLNDLKSILAGALNWFAYTNDIDKHEATKEFIKEYKIKVNS